MRRIGPHWAAVLAGIPFVFTLDLDAGAIHCPAVVCLQTRRGDQQVQRALLTTIWNVHRKRPLTAADGTEVRHVPIGASHMLFQNADDLIFREP